MQEPDIKRALNLKRLMLAIAMTACIAGHAGAATPKAESTVTADRITLGDVFDGVRDHADYYLAPAPEMGRTVTLNARDLLRISEALNLGWTPENNMQQVVIRRSSGIIDRDDIQAAVQKKLAAELKGQKFEMELSDRSVSFRVPDSTDKTVDVEKLAYDAVRGEFKATVSAAAAPAVKKEIKGRFYQISRLPVLKEPFRQGDVISANDIDYIEIRSTDITSSMVVDAARLIGRTPRRGLSALKPVTAGDVQSPLVVKKGDLVTMVLTGKIISLTAQGRALDNGSEGEAIRVMNTSSKQVIGAVVTGPQTVSIKPPMNTL